MNLWRRYYPVPIYQYARKVTGAFTNDRVEFLKSDNLIIETTFDGEQQELFNFGNEDKEFFFPSKCTCEFSKKHRICKHTATVFSAREKKIMYDFSYKNIEEFIKDESLLDYKEDTKGYNDFCLNTYLFKEIITLRMNNKDTNGVKDALYLLWLYLKERIDSLSLKDFQYLMEVLDYFYFNYNFNIDHFKHIGHLCIQYVLESINNQAHEIFHWLYKRIDLYKQFYLIKEFTDIFYEYFTDDYYIPYKLQLTLNYVEIEEHLADEKYGIPDFTYVWVTPALELMILAGKSNQEQDDFAKKYIHFPIVKQWYDNHINQDIRIVTKPIIETIKEARQ